MSSDLEIALSSDDCSGTNYAVDAFEPNETCTDATVVAPRYFPSLWTTKLHGSNGDVDWFTIQVPARQEVTIRGISQDQLDITPYSRSCANITTLIGTEFTYVNSGPGQANVFFSIRADSTNGRACAEYDLDVSMQPIFGPGVSGFCVPGLPNSHGRATTLTGEVGAFPGAGLQLRSVNGPTFAVGCYLVAPQFSDQGVPVSSGRMCLAGSSGPGGSYGIGRYNVANTPMYSVGQFNFGGQSITLDEGGLLLDERWDVPAQLPLGGGIPPGETWHFRLLHRDGPTSSNFSNGIAVTF